jgi:hypothetical protein
VNPEFSGEERPFAAGSVFGLRAWLVKPDGTLVAPAQGEELQPGVNHAVCDIGQNPMWQELLGKGQDHAIGCTPCFCGYYAYTTGKNPYFRQQRRLPMIQGIIEGSGVVTEGSKGFRAAKAELMGVVDPNAKNWHQPGSRGQIAIDVVFLATYVLNAVLRVAEHHYWSALLWVGLCGMFVVFLRRDLIKRGSTIVDPELIHRVQEKYPEVEVFTSLRKLRKAYPLSRQPRRLRIPQRLRRLK